MTQRHILVTTALPYANGSIHLGHMVEHIQADIWVRFQKMQHHLCYFVCGDDAHGTPIMLSAEKQGISPEQLIAAIQQEHQQDFNDFHIGFDHYGTTHCPDNQALANLIYQRLKDRGDIEIRTISQAFDAVKHMFLPDRFIKGHCPQCHAADQYGDSCEACGATYSPTELKNPISALSGTAPIQRQSEHYFFQLPHYAEPLKAWITQGHLQPQVANKLLEWFEAGLQAWDISRDAPYFGFEIPDAPGKYFYVWLDAPIGYMTSFKQLCAKTPNLSFEQFWHADSTSELYHFVGKDIIYFHALFWPAMLSGANFRTPTAIFTHGFLTVDGQKMSKSRGTFIKARTYLEHLHPEYLRYYFAAKLNPGVDDLDLNLTDFMQRVNADLIGKLINIASRSAGFIHKYFDGVLKFSPQDEHLLHPFSQAATAIASAYEQREYAKAMREIMALADKANCYIAEQQPWQLVKEAVQLAAVQTICSVAINMFRILMVYLKPVLPVTTQLAEQFLNCPPLQWLDHQHYLNNHTINPFTPMLPRIEMNQIDAMISASQTETTPQAQPLSAPVEPIAATISYEDFAKIDLRVAKIIKAEAVAEADKLLRLELDLGNEIRQVFAGIKAAYAPEQLVGKLTVMVANLAPRKMRFGLSEGMVLAAGPGGRELFILQPEQGATPGMKVK